MTTFYLVELRPVRAADNQEVVLRYSSSPRETTTDSHSWRPLLSSALRRSSQVFDGSFSSRPQDYGSIEIALDRSDDRSPANSSYYWDERPANIWRGTSGQSLSQMEVVFSGKTRAFSATKKGFSVSLRGPSLTQQLLSLTCSGNGDYQGTPSLLNTPRPLLLGSAQNIEPLYLDKARGIFQYHGYGPAGGLTAVYDSASLLGASTGDFADYEALKTAVVPGGRFATCNALGLGRHGGEIQGVLTVDAVGAVPSGLPGSVVRWILSSRLGLPSQAYDGPTLSWLDAEFPYPQDVYLTELRSAEDFLSDFLLSLGGYTFFLPDGRLSLGLVRRGSPLSATLDSQNIAQGLRLMESRAAVWKQRVGWGRSWRVHSYSEVRTPREIVPRGAFSAGVNYQYYELVEHSNSSWLYVSSAAGSTAVPGNDATVWQRFRENGAATSVSETAPENPVEGMTWRKPSTGEHFVRIGTSWVLYSTLGATIGTDLRFSSGVVPAVSRIDNNLITLDSSGRLVNTGAGSAVLDNSKVSLTDGAVAVLNASSVVLQNAVAEARRGQATLLASILLAQTTAMAAIPTSLSALDVSSSNLLTATSTELVNARGSELNLLNNVNRAGTTAVWASVVNRPTTLLALDSAAANTLASTTADLATARNEVSGLVANLPLKASILYVDSKFQSATDGNSSTASSVSALTVRVGNVEVGKATVQALDTLQTTVGTNHSTFTNFRDLQTGVNSSSLTTLNETVSRVGASEASISALTAQQNTDRLSSVSRSDLLSARVQGTERGEAINPNTLFTDWPLSDAVAVGWSDWAWGWISSRASGTLGGAVPQFSTGVRTDHGWRCDLSGKLTRGWYVVELSLRLTSGSLAGAGAHLSWGPSGGVDRHVNLSCSAEKDSSGTAPGPGTPGTTYRWSKLFNVDTACDISQLYAMAIWSGYGPVSDKTVSFERLLVRPASQPEVEARTATATLIPAVQATVLQNTAALADLAANKASVTRVDTLETSLQGQINSKASIARVDSVETTAAGSLASARSALETEFRGADSGLSSRASSLEARTTAVESGKASFGYVDAQVAVVAGANSSTNSSVTALTSRVGAVEANRATLTQLETLQTTVGTNNSTFVTFRDLQTGTNSTTSTRLDVTESRFGTGSPGANLVPNSSFAAGLFGRGWGLGGPGGVSGGLNQPGYGTTVNPAAFYTTPGVLSAGQDMDVYSQWIPILPNRRYDARVLLACHRCQSIVYTLLGGPDKTMLAVGQYTVGGRVGGGHEGLPANFDLVGDFFTSGPTDYWALFVVRGSGTGESNPYVFFQRPLLSACSPGQTSPTPYGAGPTLDQSQRLAEAEASVSAEAATRASAVSAEALTRSGLIAGLNSRIDDPTTGLSAQISARATTSQLNSAISGEQGARATLSSSLDTRFRVSSDQNLLPNGLFNRGADSWGISPPGGVIYDGLLLANSCRVDLTSANVNGHYYVYSEAVIPSWRAATYAVQARAYYNGIVGNVCYVYCEKRRASDGVWVFCSDGVSALSSEGILEHKAQVPVEVGHDRLRFIFRADKSVTFSGTMVCIVTQVMVTEWRGAYPVANDGFGASVGETENRARITSAQNTANSASGVAAAVRAEIEATYTGGTTSLSGRLSAISSTSANADSVTSGRVSAMEVQRNNRADSILPDSGFYDAAWLRGQPGLPSGTVSVEGTENNQYWSSPRGIEIRGTSFDFYTPYFPVEVGVSYRIRFRLYNNNPGWTGTFWPLIHMPAVQWFSLKHGTAVDPSVADANNAVVAAGDTLDLEWIVINPSSAANYGNRMWQLRFKGAGMSASSGAYMQLNVTRLPHQSEINAAKARITTVEGATLGPSSALVTQGTELQLARDAFGGGSLAANLANIRTLVQTGDDLNVSRLDSLRTEVTGGPRNSLNSNPEFRRYAGATGVPDQWQEWSNGGTCSRVNSLYGATAMRMSSAALDTGIQQEVGLLLQPGWYVMEASVVLESGSLNAAGLHAAAVSPAAASSHNLSFRTTSPSGGAVPGAGVPGAHYHFSKLVQFTNAGATYAKLYVMNNWSGFGAAVSANVMTWTKALIRPASQPEIDAKSALELSGTNSASITSLSNIVSGPSGLVSKVDNLQLSVSTRANLFSSPRPLSGRTSSQQGWDAPADLNAFWGPLGGPIYLRSRPSGGPAATEYYVNRITAHLWGESSYTVSCWGYSGPPSTLHMYIEALNPSTLAIVGQSPLVQVVGGQGNRVKTTSPSFGAQNLIYRIVFLATYPASSSYQDSVFADIKFEVGSNATMFTLEGQAEQLQGQITATSLIAADAQGKVNAQNTLVLNVNGHISGRTSFNNGSFSSTVFTNDSFSIADTSGVVQAVFRNSANGGSVISGANLVGATATPENGGPPRKLVLAPLERAGADGATVSWSPAFSSLPNVRPIILSPPQLSAGETYEIKAVGLTTSGFTVSAKKFSSGTPVAQASGAGSNVGGTPAWQANKPTTEDADNNFYVFRFSGTMPRINQYFEPGIGWEAYYEAEFDLYAFAYGSWQIVGRATVSDYDYGTTSRPGSRAFSNFQTAQTLPSVGTTGGNEFGVQPTGGGSVTSFEGVSYTTTTQSSVVSLPGLHFFEVS